LSPFGRNFGRTESAPTLVIKLPSGRIEQGSRLASPMKSAIDVLSAAHLFNATTAHDDDPIRHGQCFFLIVSHEHEGDSELRLEMFKLDLDALAQLQIERAQRLIQQKKLGTVDDCSSQRDALLLAA
jgi:hypothetical protein